MDVSHLLQTRVELLVKKIIEHVSSITIIPFHNRLLYRYLMCWKTPYFGWRKGSSSIVGDLVKVSRTQESFLLLSSGEEIPVFIRFLAYISLLHLWLNLNGGVLVINI